MRFRNNFAAAKRQFLVPRPTVWFHFNKDSAVIHSYWGITYPHQQSQCNINKKNHLWFGLWHTFKIYAEEKEISQILSTISKRHSQFDPINYGSLIFLSSFSMQIFLFNFEKVLPWLWSSSVLPLLWTTSVNPGPTSMIMYSGVLWLQL